MLHTEADVTRILSDGCLVRGNPNHFMGPAFVAFIDLLGMSRIILTEWGAQTDQALWRLLRIKAGVPGDDQESQITVCESDPATNKDIEKYLTVTRTISDSIVTMIALPNKISPPCRLTYRLSSLLLNIRLVWQQALKEGFTVRGAIEFGEIFWNEAEIIGPALVNAYRLESQFANTSRVLVGPELIKLITSIAESDESLSGPYSPLHTLTVSDDGLIIIDPHVVFTSNQINSIRVLQEKAGDKRDKYEELIQLLGIPGEKVRRPSRKELIEAIVVLTRR